MRRTEEDEVPNDPRQHRSRGRAVRLHGPAPWVLGSSLALWLLLLTALPAWLLAGLVVALFAGCAACALGPLLPGAGRPGIRVIGLARGS